MISLRQKGNFRRLRQYLTIDYPEQSKSAMEHAGMQGKAELRANTPVKTGRTRDHWHYKTIKLKDGYRVSWYNTNLTRDGLPLIVLLEYGHGTRNGGYVPGTHFIRNSMRPVKEEISKRLRPVTKPTAAIETDTEVSEE